MDLLNFLLILTGSTALVLIVKRLFDTRITPRGHMLLWLVIAVQLLAWPLTERLPEADWSLKGWMPQVYEAEEVLYAPYNPAASSQNVHAQGNGEDGITGITDERTDMQGADAHAQEGSQSAYMMQQRLSFRMPGNGADLKTGYIVTDRDQVVGRMLVNWIWPLSSLLAALVVAAGGIGQRRKLAGLPRCNPAAQSGKALLDCFLEVKELAGVKARVDLRTGADSTMLAGLLRPTVYLAKDLTLGLEGRVNRCGLEMGGTTGAGEGGGAAALDLTALRHVFAHELIHYRHRDQWLNVAAAVVICIFWWNPVMWLAFRRFRRDMEVYCDYDAVRLLDDKKGYARTLVRAAAGSSRFVVGTTSLIDGEKEVSRRVKALAAFKKPKTWVCVLAAGILLGICVGLMVNPLAEQAKVETGDLVYGRMTSWGFSGGGTIQEVEAGQMDVFDDVIEALGEAEVVRKEDAGDDYETMVGGEISMYQGLAQLFLEKEGGGGHQISYYYGRELQYPVLIQLANGNVFLSRDEALIEEMEDLFYEWFGAETGLYRSLKLPDEGNWVCAADCTPEEAIEAYVTDYVQKQFVGTYSIIKDWGLITEYIVSDYGVMQMTERKDVVMGRYDFAFRTEQMENFYPVGDLEYGEVRYGEGVYADMAAGAARFVLALQDDGWHLSEWGPNCWLSEKLDVRQYAVPDILTAYGANGYRAVGIEYLTPLSSASTDAFLAGKKLYRYRLEDGTFMVETPDGQLERYENVYIKERLLADRIWTAETAYGQDAYGQGESGQGESGQEESEANMYIALNMELYDAFQSREFRIYSDEKDTGYRFYFLAGGKAASQLWLGEFSQTPSGGSVCQDILRLEGAE